MNKRIGVIAAIIGVVFVFAGYNLYSYFKEQQAIQLEEDRLALERQELLARAQAEREAKAKAEEARLQAEREAEQKRLEEERAAEATRREEERLAAEAKRKAREEAAEQAEREREAARFAKKVERARAVPSIEGMDEEELWAIRSVSPRYLREHPEVASQVFTSDPNIRRLAGPRLFFKDQSTYFMLLAAASNNPDALKAALDAGADINATNVEGYTALMFAAAYNSADIVTFLIEQGADVSPTASKFELNALHIAALMNPHPDVVEALVKLGMDINAKSGPGDTALVLAASENRNLEVPLRLVELGADKTAYAAENGLTAHAIVAGRLENYDARLRRITDEFNEQVLKALE